MSRAAQFSDRPDVKAKMTAAEAKWAAMTKETDTRTEKLQAALHAWETYDELAGRVQNLASNYDSQVAAQVSTERGLELETVDRQLGDAKVSD